MLLRGPLKIPSSMMKADPAMQCNFLSPLPSPSSGLKSSLRDNHFTGNIYHISGKVLFSGRVLLSVLLNCHLHSMLNIIYMQSVRYLLTCITKQQETSCYGFVCFKSVCDKCVTCLWEVVGRSPLGYFLTVGLSPLNPQWCGLLHSSQFSSVFTHFSQLFF